MQCNVQHGSAKQCKQSNAKQSKARQAMQSKEQSKAKHAKQSKARQSNANEYKLFVMIALGEFAKRFLDLRVRDIRDVRRREILGSGP